MDDLQAMLLLAGILLVLGVFTYNKWQEWRHRRLAERVFADAPSDLLMNGETLSSARSSASDAYDQRREPILDPLPIPPEERLHDDVETQVEPPAHQEHFLPEFPNHLVHPDTDARIHLELLSALTADALFERVAALPGGVGRSVFWLGLDDSGQWRTLSLGLHGVFKHLWAFLPLVDRRGLVGVPALNQFMNAMEMLATDLNAVVDVSDLDSAVMRAQELDRFCAEVDLQIGLNLMSAAPLLGGRILALAEAAGMFLNDEGQFEMQDARGIRVFVVSNIESSPFTLETLPSLQTHGMTFLLDVPRVREGGKVFDHMLRLARQFAEALNAHLVDDHRHPLSEAQLAQTRAEFVIKPQSEMALHGIDPGGAIALRLFA